MLKLKNLFTEILEESGKLRLDYPDSLGGHKVIGLKLYLEEFLVV